MKARVNFLRVILALVFAQAPKDNGFNRKRESCTQFSKIWRRNSQLSNNRQTSRQSKEEKVDFQVYRRKTRVKDNQLLYQILANASSIERTCKNGPFGSLCKSHIFFLIYLILEFLKIVPFFMELSVCQLTFTMERYLFYAAARRFFARKKSRILEQSESLST